MPYAAEQFQKWVCHVQGCRASEKLEEAAMEGPKILSEARSAKSLGSGEWCRSRSLVYIHTFVYCVLQSHIM